MRPVDIDVTVPGSKSLTNRAMICAALAEGKSELVNASPSDDSRLLARALEGGPTWFGNAGTALRFFTAYAALRRGRYVIDGDARMRERPIRGLLEALNALGARATVTDYPPVTLEACGLAGGRARIAGETSSQFVSAVLLAAPYAAAPVMLEVEGAASKPYIDMTLSVMSAFGVRVERDGYRAFVVSPAKYRACRYEVEPDAASANYFYAMAAVTRGRARVPGVSSIQGEARFLDVLRAMGCEVRGDEVRGGPLRGVDVDMNDIPDSVQTLAAVALFADGPTRVRNVPNLRVKETDRIAALATELRRLGASVREFPDGLEIVPGPLRPARIETYGDHRMAMSFAVAAVAAPGIEIAGRECVSKSFPGFWDTLRRLGLGD